MRVEKSWQSSRTRPTGVGGISNVLGNFPVSSGLAGAQLYEIHSDLCIFFFFLKMDMPEFIPSRSHTAQMPWSFISCYKLYTLKLGIMLGWYKCNCSFGQ